MTCPTCDHTMHQLGCCVITGMPFFWCVRCGTIKTCDNEPAAPALVTRCQTFEDALANPITGAVGANLRLLWHTLGIDESINVPGRRPQ